jgi:DNA-binding transcriptional LysR family regulator
MTTLTEPQALRAFVAVAREGNVSRAAQRLHLSQPAVSLQLKRLAQTTGLVLFTRTPHGLALTPDGAALLPQAEKALAALADFGQAAQRLHSTVRGRLRIGTILDPEFTRLGAFLKQLVESAPQIETELRQGMSGDVLAQIGRGELDVGFYLVPLAAPAGTFEQNEPVPSVEWTQSAIHFEVIILTRFTYRVLARVFGPGSLTGVEPRRVALVDQEASMLDLVKSGVGLSLVRDSIAMRESQARGLVVADRVSLDCALSFVCQKGRAGEPVIAAARQALYVAWR